MQKKVSIIIVTWNSMQYLPKCLESINNQTYKNKEIIMIDNASNDHIKGFIKKFPNIVFLQNKENLGFSRGQNQGINKSSGDYILALNPDVLMVENFLEEMVRAIELKPEIGAASGKLYLIRDDFAIQKNKKTIDSTGIISLKNRRNLDRGNGIEDIGQFDKLEYIFGVSGAAALYKKEMLEDIKIGDEYFDELFFALKEDVDLSWRSQIMGWKTVYNPCAIAYHARRVTSKTRKYLNPELKMHSIKNRYIMILKNETMKNYLRHLPFILLRDLLILGYLPFFETKSIQGLFYILKNLNKISTKRRIIHSKKRVDDNYLIQWFGRIESLPFNKDKIDYGIKN